MGFWYTLRGWLLAPLQLLVAPFGWFGEQLSGPAKSRALVLGIPALVTGLACLVVLAAVALGSEGRLLSHYEALADAARREAEASLLKFHQEMRVSSQRMRTEGEASKEERDNNPVWQQYVAQRQLQQMYLEKLIKLDRDPKYLFQLALSFTELDPDRQNMLLEELAPADRVGYWEAHYFMAQVLNRMVAADRDQERRIRNLALNHADFALQFKPDLAPAKEIKLMSYLNLGRFSEGLTLAEEMYRSDPIYVRPLYVINREINRGDANPNLLQDAARRLEDKIREHRQDNIDAWSKYINAYAEAMALNNQFEDARARVKQEMDLFSEAADGGRIVFLRRIDAELAIGWAKSLNPQMDAPVEVVEKALELLSDGLKVIPRNAEALWIVTMIANRKDEVREKAIAIYDPFNDPNAPPVVLNQLGKQHLIDQNYASAIDYFERARQVDPRNPEMLNNLAYAYLSAGVGDPENALMLVNEAISLLPATSGAVMWRSSFYHTRGSALLRMERYEEAAAAFEIALEARPDNEGILEGLVTCYEARGLQQAEIYRAKLEMVRKRAKESGPGGP